MTENRECFTFIWKIKNFSFCNGCTDSAVFTAPIFFGSKWQLMFCPNSITYEDCVACYIKLVEILIRNVYEFDYELSFLDSDGSVLHSKTMLKRVFVMDQHPALTAKREEVYLSKKDQFICNDTLTIRCRLWSSKESVSESLSCFAVTRIETGCITFIGKIKEFGSINPILKYPVFMDSSSYERSFFSLNLFISADDKLCVEVSPTKFEKNLYRLFKIFIWDVFGNEVKCGQAEFSGLKPLLIPFTISKDFLIKHKEQYLPMDELTIHCEEIFAEGRMTNEIEYAFESQDNQKVASEAKSTDDSSEEYHIEDLATLKEDLISMFIEGTLCDTEIRTGNAIFPVHMTVLSARSPVFKSMFTTDMKEKLNKCVDIDDLDEDTVRRMLLFMYSDKLEDLDYESAKNLYFAADKYNIVSLRHRCSSLLKQSIMLSNCCDILLLADKHQDNGLKKVAHDYIAKNDEAVFLTEEWTNFEKNNPQLAIAVFRSVYIQKRK